MARTWIDQHGMRRVLSEKRLAEQDAAVQRLMYTFSPTYAGAYDSPSSADVHRHAGVVGRMGDDLFAAQVRRAFWSWSYDRDRTGARMSSGSPHENLQFLRDYNASLLRTFVDAYKNVYEDEMRRAVRGLAREYFLRLRKEYRKTEQDMFMEL